ncbi:MAG: class I SAM-dependent methyltransferase, partial [Mesorhizobium sp.]
MSPEIPPYKTTMMDVTQPRNAALDGHEQALDLT